MKKTVFYSWQSDLPNATNRGFIETALERATAAIAADDTIEVEPVLDRDTQGVAGSPDISATIFKKIEESDVFVADVSIIGKLSNNRPVPNPNVLVELGYAIKTLEYSRVILVFNLAFGTPADLPFDLRTRRVITYNAPEGSDKAEERKKLSNIFKTAVMAALSINKEGPVAAVPPFENAISLIENRQPNKVIKLRQELKKFFTNITAQAPKKFSEGGTVDELIQGINSTLDLITQFARLLHTIAIMDDKEAALEVQKWFGTIIEKYDAPRGYQGLLNDNDFDYYKFLGQELYAILIASLLKEEKWRTIQQLFREWIPVEYMRPMHGPYNATFKDISKFIASLHYESEKRGKISLQANILKEHFDNPDLSEILSFEDYQAADLFMYMVIEMGGEQQVQFHSWRPVSFVFLHNTPRFLLKAQRRSYAEFLAETCTVNDIKVFRERLITRLPKINNIFNGNLHHWPIKPEDITRIGTTP